MFSHDELFSFLCRYNDGTVKLRNPNIELMDQDILYHLALGSGSHDLEEMFGDVKVSHDKQFKTFTHLTQLLSVRLHGWHTEAHGKLCTFYHGRNRLQIASGNTVARHQCFFVSLLHVQSRLKQ